VGAFLGGWIGSFFGWGTVDSFSLRSLLLAIGGSLIVLFVYAGISKRR